MACRANNVNLSPLGKQAGSHGVSVSCASSAWLLVQIAMHVCMYVCRCIWIWCACPCLFLSLSLSLYICIYLPIFLSPSLSLSLSLCPGGHESTSLSLSLHLCLCVSVFLCAWRCVFLLPDIQKRTLKPKTPGSTFRPCNRLWPSSLWIWFRPWASMWSVCPSG